jgi:glutaminase
LHACTPQRFEHLVDVWQELIGLSCTRPKATQTKAKNHRNYALAYMMVRTHTCDMTHSIAFEFDPSTHSTAWVVQSDLGALPEGTDIETTLSLYSMLCSMELTCKELSVVAATLANGGVNPFTEIRVFDVCCQLMNDD